MFNINYIELFILNTLIYFDLFDYPLTLLEIHQYLYTGGMEGSSYTLLEIEDCLNNSENLKKIIASKNGFYFLQSREDIIEMRQKRYVLAEYKFKLARRAIQIFKYLPFIKLVAVCNNLAYLNAKKDSDIDLFVIIAKNRLWLSRFFLIIIITLLGLRPPKEKAKDKICLSFYVTEDNLNLEPIKIASEDIYLNFWLVQLLPLYQRENFYDKFMDANLWLKKYFPNFTPKKVGQRLRIDDSKINANIYELKEYFWQGKWGDMLETWLKNWQIKKMSQQKKDMAILGDKRVIISDNMLKFHENDRRLEYLEKFERKRKELIEKL